MLSGSDLAKIQHDPTHLIHIIVMLTNKIAQYPRFDKVSGRYIVLHSDFVNITRNEIYKKWIDAMSCKPEDKFDEVYEAYNAYLEYLVSIA